MPKPIIFTDSDFLILEYAIDSYLELFNELGINSNVLQDIESAKPKVLDDAIDFTHEEVNALITASDSYRDSLREILNGMKKGTRKEKNIARDLRRINNLLPKLRAYKNAFESLEE